MGYPSRASLPLRFSLVLWFSSGYWRRVHKPLPPAIQPSDSVDPVVFPARPSAAKTSGPGVPGGGEPAAFVPTEVVPGIPPARSLAHLSRNLKRGAEINRVRGYETKRQLVQLHCFEGKSIPECARLMGRSYRALHAVWRGVVAEASGERGGGIDYRLQVKALCDRSLRELLQVSIPLVAESAAHGAVVLKTVEALRSLHGVDGIEDKEAVGMTLEEIGASVRVVSPLLADKLERVKALGMGQIAAGLKVAKE